MSQEKDDLDLSDTPQNFDLDQDDSRSTDTAYYDERPSEPSTSCNRPSSSEGPPKRKTTTPIEEELEDYDNIKDEFSSPVFQRKKFKSSDTNNGLEYDSDSETLLQPGKSFLVKDTSCELQIQDTAKSRKRHSDFSEENFDKCNLSKIFKLSPKVPKEAKNEKVVRRRTNDRNIDQGSRAADKSVQKSSSPRADTFRKNSLSTDDFKVVREMFPDIEEITIQKIFDELQQLNGDDILQRVIEFILTTQELSSSSSLGRQTSSQDVQTAMGNPRPNILKQESSSSLSGQTDDMPILHSRTRKWKKGSFASSSKGKAPAEKIKNQQVSPCQSDVNMMEMDGCVDNNYSYSSDSDVILLNATTEKHPVSFAEVSSSQLKCDGCNKSHDTTFLSQCCNDHLVCKSCVEKQVKKVISPDSQETQIPCPINGCETYIPESQASKVLPPLIMELLEEKVNKKALESITKMEDFHSCPFCEFPVAVDHGLKKFLCPNPDCVKLSCKYCKKLWNEKDHKSCTAFMTLSEESKEHLELPRYWHPMPDEQQDFILVELDRQGREFTLIKDLFCSSMRHIHPISIHRVQNPRLWQKFSLARKHISEEFGPNMVNEQQLFHGTKCEAIEAICRSGLDWRMCGENGVAFGQGTYFAKHAEYSDGYCQHFTGRLVNPSNPYQPLGFSFGAAPPAHFSYAVAPPPSAQIVPKRVGNSIYFITVQGTGGQQQQPSSGSSGASQNPNALSGIGSQTGFGTITYGTPFGTDQPAQTSSKPKSSTAQDKPKVISDIKQILREKHKYMFVARVLVGRPGQGRPGMRKPPEDPADPKGRPFNSCVNTPHKPSIFVIFDSTQCYPEYIIEYMHLTSNR
ncbi:E3 ubiquitin-protein ligase RNF216-like [Saccostrea cucullata]|uniref:E3 ubiquitin-protein ligase RNF216-like n=1 Tax=Saccostrea cuccullata TaxID=36930 RepID=UPI002ED60589